MEDELLISELPFTVSARTARLIGQENFANAEGAIIELVKNSYDADATICFIIVDPLNDMLHIFDNGDGMEEDTIKKHWMTIGTDDKRNNERSGSKRVRTGAKGIGRFALDRLGKSSRMVTKPLLSEKLVWNVDWEQFDKTGAVIQDIKARLTKSGTSFFDEVDFVQAQTGLILNSSVLSSSAVGFDGMVTKESKRKAFRDFWTEEKGTIISIRNLRDSWDEATVSSLYSNLEILAPPIETNIFQIYLYSTLEPEKYGIVRPTICDDYDYKLTAVAAEDKSVTVDVVRNELNVNELKRIGFFDQSNLPVPRYALQTFEVGSFKHTTSLAQLVAGFKSIDKDQNLSKIGPFSFTFYFMKRGSGEKDEAERYPYKAGNYRDRAKWLDVFGGVKIYRDNFRVRPYGEIKGNSFDWLDLGSRSASSPAVTKRGYKVRPNQVYGIVNISRIGNVQFDDKSGREGIRENDAFTLFKEILIELIGIFEKDRNEIMIALKKLSNERDKKQKAQTAADAIIEKAKKDATGHTSPSAEESQTLITAIEAYKEEIEDLKDEQKLLRVLASAGLIVTSFAHELKNLSDSIVPRTEDLKALLDSLIDQGAVKNLPDYLNPYVLIDDMRTQDERLKTWLDFSLASVRKDKRSRRTINMVTYIEGLERTWQPLLSRRHVKLTIDKWKWEQVNFRGHEIDLDGIFNNLIANSVDAFKRQDAGDHRHINLSFIYNPNDPKGLGIGVVYEDSGPGLEPEIQDPTEIFQPFFTTKRDERTGEKVGTGLGMWIVRSVIDEYEGDLTFMNVRPGFKLKIILPHH